MSVVLGYLLVRDSGSVGYDDSYFFKRVAVNALDHGSFAWNVADGPVYGNTSQTFQMVVLVVTALVRDHVVLGLKVVNFAFLCGLAVLLARFCGAATRRSTDGVMIALCVLMTPLVLSTLTTGMETALTLLLVAASLVWMFRDPSVGSDLGAAGWTAAIYLCRPDAALIPAVAWGALQWSVGKRPVRYLLGLAALMVPILLISWVYYRSPLPLSFFAKTHGLSVYGEHMQSLGWDQKAQHFGMTLVFCAPLLWVACQRPDRRTWPLLVSTFAFWGYHLAMTNEIMGYLGRFYAPGVVGLSMGAARSWDRFIEETPIRRRVGFLTVWLGGVVLLWFFGLLLVGDGAPSSTRVVAVFLALGASFVWLLLGKVPSSPWRMGLVATLGFSLGACSWRPPEMPALSSDDEIVEKHVKSVTSFRGIYDVKRCLPQIEHLYHSEVGVPGLLFPRTRVVDLAGLQSRGHGTRRGSFQARCDADRPEVIFLPHRNYAKLNAEIASAACFLDYKPAVDRSSSPLHVRNDLYDEFMKCASHPLRGGDM